MDEPHLRPLKESLLVRPSSWDILEIGLGLLGVAACAIAARGENSPVLAIPALGMVSATSLSSHKRRMKSDESDVPILAAIAFSFAVLLVLLFNYSPTLLWGLTHFEDQPAVVMWVAIGILAVLWHAYPLSLIHAIARHSFDRRPVPWPLFYGLPAILFWVCRSYFINEDGFGCLAVARGDIGLDRVIREPLAYTSFRVVRVILGPLGVDARDAVRMVSVASGLASLCALRRLWRLWRLDARQTALAWGTAAATFGLTQMWFGHIEVYPPFSAAVVWLFYLASKALRQRSPLWLPGVAYALAFAFHVAGAWLAPGMAALIWLASRDSERRRSLRSSIVEMAAPFAVIHAFLWGMIAVVGFHLDLRRFAEALGNVVTAARTSPPFYSLREMNWIYWLDRGQMVFVLCGAPLALVALLRFFSIARWGKAPRAPGFVSGASKSEMLCFLAALGGYGLYAWAWRPERSWPHDWDLFSALAPMVLLVCLRLILARSPERIPYRAGQIVLGLFLVLSGLNVRYYHTHPTALGSHRFLYIPPQHGYELQKYLVDYPVSDMEYPIFRDGRVVLTTDGENR